MYELTPYIASNSGKAVLALVNEALPLVSYKYWVGNIKVVANKIHCSKQLGEHLRTQKTSCTDQLQKFNDLFHWRWKEIVLEASSPKHVYFLQEHQLQSGTAATNFNQDCLFHFADWPYGNFLERAPLVIASASGVQQDALQSAHLTTIHFAARQATSSSKFDFLPCE